MMINRTKYAKVREVKGRAVKVYEEFPRRQGKLLKTLAFLCVLSGLQIYV